MACLLCYEGSAVAVPSALSQEIPARSNEVLVSGSTEAGIRKIKEIYQQIISGKPSINPQARSAAWNSYQGRLSIRASYLGLEPEQTAELEGFIAEIEKREGIVLVPYFIVWQGSRQSI